MNRFSILCLILLLQEKRNYLSPPQSHVKVKLVCCLLTPNRVAFGFEELPTTEMQFNFCTWQPHSAEFMASILHFILDAHPTRASELFTSNSLELHAFGANFFWIVWWETLRKKYKNGNMSWMRSLNCTILSNERKKKYIFIKYGKKFGIFSS